MGYTAKWGSKGFIVSTNKIVPLMDLTSTVSVKAETQTDTSGTAKTNNKGRELQQISLSTIYLRAAGVDPRAQIEEWESLVGKANPLLIGDKRFGPEKMMLTSVSTSEVLLNNEGKFLKATVALSFEEYSEETGTKTSASTSAATKAAATYNATVAAKKEEKAEAKASTTPTAASTSATASAEKNKALTTGASTADKSTKKRERAVINEVDRKLTTK